MILPKIASGIRHSMWEVKGMLVMSQPLVAKMNPTPIIKTTSLYMFTCREISEVILGLHPSRFWQIHICSVTSFWWFAAKASWDNFCFFHSFEEKMQISTPFQTEHCKKKIDKCRSSARCPIPRWRATLRPAYQSLPSHSSLRTWRFARSKQVAKVGLCQENK